MDRKKTTRQKPHPINLEQKMNPSKKCTAIKALLFAVLMAAGMTAWAAQVAGAVTNLSGALMAKKADGSVKILAVKSEIEQGDTLVSEKNTYAQIRFIDNSEITLKPNTTFKVEAFAYEADKPAADAATFSLVKGGLRSITGLLGKRNKEKFSLKTPTATIGIRGTTFTADLVDDTAESVAAREDYLMASTAGLDGQLPLKPLQLAQMAPPKPSSGPALAPGLYVHVIDGLILVSNPAGVANFAPGQFGFTPSLKQPPVLLPANPGIKFTPPPAFNSTGVSGNTGTPPKSNNVDCEVR
jgi:hypothetical protein